MIRVDTKRAMMFVFAFYAFTFRTNIQGAEAVASDFCRYFYCDDSLRNPPVFNPQTASKEQRDFFDNRILLKEFSSALTLKMAENEKDPKGLQKLINLGALHSQIFRDNLAHPSVIKARKVFYNRATGRGFGNGAAGNPANSIDHTKVALLPGASASAANYTNYSRGLNGIIVDLFDPRGTPTAADFRFARWNGIDAAGFVDFVPTAKQLTVTVIKGVGEGKSDRIKIEFSDKLVTNTWLKVVLLASPATALPKDDVFYFGNLMGDVNGPSRDFVTVNVLDTNRVRGSQGSTPVLISNSFDVDHSGAINVLDTNFVRGLQGSASLKMIKP
jgi:hypothetical protein